MTAGDNDGGEGKASRSSLIIAVLFAVVAPIIPIVMIVASQLSFGQVNDLPQYFAAGKLIVEGKGALVYSLRDLFAAEQHWFPSLGERGIGLFLAPCGLPFLVPVSFLPVSAAPAVWTLALAGSLIGGLLVVRRLFGLSLTGMLWLFAVVSLCGPAYESLRIGQPAPFLFLALAAALVAWRDGRTVVGSLFLAVLLLKPQELLPFMIYAAGARRYRGVLLVSGFGVILSLLAFLLIGPVGFANYFQLLSDPSNLSLMQPELNPTWRGQLLRLPGLPSSVANLVGVFVVALTCVFLFALGRRMSGCKDWLEAGIIVSMPLGLVTALHCHIYDLLLMIPSLVALTRSRLVAVLPSWLTLVGFAAMAPFLLPFYVNVQYNYLLKDGVVNPHFIVLALLSTFLSVLVWHRRQDFQ